MISWNSTAYHPETFADSLDSIVILTALFNTHFAAAGHSACSPTPWALLHVERKSFKLHANVEMVKWCSVAEVIRNEAPCFSSVAFPQPPPNKVNVSLSLARRPPLSSGVMSRGDEKARTTVSSRQVLTRFHVWQVSPGRCSWSLFLRKFYDANRYCD